MNEARSTLRGTVLAVAALNGAMFFVEGGIALAVGSVSLIADSVDFAEDFSINALVLAGLAWSAGARARLGTGLAFVLLAPGVATLLMAWARASSHRPPDAVAISATALLALAVNALCAWLLARHRSSGGSLVKAAFLSARNDTIGNLAVIGAGLLTAVWPTPWPDLAVGLGIAALNAGAAKEVWDAAHEERAAIEPG